MAMVDASMEHAHTPQCISCSHISGTGRSQNATLVPPARQRSHRDELTVVLPRLERPRAVASLGENKVRRVGRRCRRGAPNRTDEIAPYLVKRDAAPRRRAAPRRPRDGLVPGL